MILHIILNTLFVFLVLTLLIEFCLYAFRVEHHRIRCLCRSLPMMKLPFDLVTYGLLGYVDTFFINLNPFSCKVYVQQLILSVMPDQIRSDFSPIETVIIPEYIGMQIPAPWLTSCLIGFMAVSSLLILRKAIYIYVSRRAIKRMFLCSSLCEREVSNPNLREELSQSHTVILTSSELQIPLAAYRHYILVPKQLVEEFSQEEFDAVIAHEFAHLSWRDPLLKIAFSTICTLFWWIPTIWWLKKLEVDQENACDSRINKYGIRPLSLATAILKVIQQVKRTKFTYDLAPTCSLHSTQSDQVKRFEFLLQETPIPRSLANLTLQALGGSACVLICLFFWMC